MICEQFLKTALEAFKLNNTGFEAELRIQLDRTIPRLPVAPLDISKVFLNIFMNAFYSMNEKKKSEPGFKAILEIESRIINQRAVFAIRDNGLGVPEEILKKVFNPFFTTKPTGKGTGLGLSISNDILKAHGGSISCSNLDSGGAEFQLELPIDS
jgi:signal transduction histidine kinase